MIFHIAKVLSKAFKLLSKFCSDYCDLITSFFSLFADPEHEIDLTLEEEETTLSEEEMPDISDLELASIESEYKAKSQDRQVCSYFPTL